MTISRFFVGPPSTATLVLNILCRKAFAPRLSIVSLIILCVSWSLCSFKETLKYIIEKASYQFSTWPLIWGLIFVVIMDWFQVSDVVWWPIGISCHYLELPNLENSMIWSYGSHFNIHGLQVTKTLEASFFGIILSVRSVSCHLLVRIPMAEDTVLLVS